MNTIKKHIIALVVAVVALLSVSCEHEFDRPPFDEPTSLWTANITIAELLTRYDAANKYTVVIDTLFIEGVVTANDISGNIYKKIFIQDSTAALDIEINLNNIYNLYKVGQKVVISVNGMALGNYRGQPQLAAPGDGGTERLTELQCAEHIDKVGFANITNVPDPKVLTIAELDANYLDYIGHFVQIDSVSFDDAGLLFADPEDEVGNATNRVVTDATGSLELRNSIFALFANDTIPEGIGNIVGIFAIYGEYKQFFLRDKNDIQFPAE